jgi:hypothetical protein
MKKKDEKIIIPEGHKLRTRRDFLSHGLISMGALTAVPSLLGVLSSKAHAAMDCEVAQAVIGKTPIIIFDLAGGANIPGSNVMVGGAGGQMDFLQSYTTLGLPPDMHPSNQGQLDTQLGLAFHGDSSMLRGILDNTSGTTQAKIDGGIFASSSSDDTQNNPLNPMYWLNAAGAQGSLANLAGTRDSESGGRSRSPSMSINPAAQPVRINRPEDALALVNIGRLNSVFSRSQAQRILKATQRMSEQRINNFSNQSLPEQIKALVSCGYIQSQDVLNRFSEDAINASNDSDVNAVFGNLNNSDDRKTATLAKLVLEGYIGAATIEKGGYDYHNRTRSSGEQRDEQAGRLIGKVMELAARKQKDVMILVYTDGGVAARAEIDDSAAGRGKYVWTGDSGQRSSAFMMVYRHEGRATLRTGKRQIGWFKESGSVENSAMVTSNSSVNLAKAIVANYLSLSGEEGRLEGVVGDNPFGRDLDKYLIFNKL